MRFKNDVTYVLCVLQAYISCDGIKSDDANDFENQPI